MDTRGSAKTIAYLLLVVFFSFIAIVIYFIFGINYRKNRFYRFKVERNEEVYNKIVSYVNKTHHQVLSEEAYTQERFYRTVMLLYNGSMSQLPTETK